MDNRTADEKVVIPPGLDPNSKVVDDDGGDYGEPNGPPRGPALPKDVEDATDETTQFPRFRGDC